MERRKIYLPFKHNHRLYGSLIAIQIIQILLGCVESVSFSGIPAAFGDLDLNKRTDIVVIGDDGTRVDIYYQRNRQNQPPLELGYSCKSDRPVIQVYLADIDSDGNPNLLPLLQSDTSAKLFQLKSLKVKTIDLSPTSIQTTRLTPNTAYSLATAAALNSEVQQHTNNSVNTNNDSTNPLAESLALRRDPLSLTPPSCEFTDIGVEMTAQPLLFDLDGDLRTDFMSLNRDGQVTVWKPPKSGSNSEQFEQMPPKDWAWISKEYFAGPHSNAFIDINHDNSADIILSANGARIMYIYANSDPELNFNQKNIKEFLDMDDKEFKYGQSALVDVNADGKIDHILPRCKGDKCEIIILYENTRKEVIFTFTNQTDNSYDYNLEESTFARNYVFPITLRASDLDGDGYTDFVAVVKNKKDGKNKIVYLHNVLDTTVNNEAIMGAKAMKRTFEIHEIPHNYPSQNVNLVTLFDINEDGKVDMLVGSSEQSNRPYDMNVSAIMNSQMVDACFMKVLVTNGYFSAEAGSNGQSARGPFICFELSQNDGKKMQGCAGQLSQASHFALQSPYVIFGLGQTPHFVETLNVTIPGYGPDKRIRTRTLEQIVPDAQVIIIPRQRDWPSSWDYKMFLSPMSDLVFSTLIALAVLCLLLLFIIFILHRQETLEDAAEHEEYKRHWPESR